MTATIHSRALRRAADILGGTSALRDYLQVPSSQLSRWLDAAEQPPAGIFLKAVDVIVDQSLPGAAREEIGGSDPAV